MKSVISASMHKAGSTIMDLILVEFMKARGYEIDRIALEVPRSPLPERDIFIQAQDDMILEDVYYGVARGPYVAEMPILEKLKVIAQVRDPRDCITSAYFSFKVSHVPPKDPEKKKAFMERRKKLENLSIDGYALSQVESYKRRMEILRNLLNGPGETLLLRYEDMVQQTEGWLGQIGGFIDQPVTDELRETLGEKIDFSVSAEAVTKHKRQVTPGDHLRKLKPETVEQMTQKMRSELEYFGYL